MKVLVVYESMFGNTRAIAEAIGEGLRSVDDDVNVVHVSEVTNDLAAEADLLVVGSPAHGSEVRQWLDQLPASSGKAVAFDTRKSGPAWWTRHASKAITKRLCRTGRGMLHEPSSFIVSKDNVLTDGAIEAGSSWGRFIRRELHFQYILESTHAERASA
jgi:flavorubredoxin